MLLIYQPPCRDDNHTAKDVPAVSGSRQTHDLPRSQYPRATAREAAVFSSPTSRSISRASGS